MGFEMEELSQLLLMNRGAPLLLPMEKERSLLLSQLEATELAQFSSLKQRRSVASTKG